LQLKKIKKYFNRGIQKGLTHLIKTHLVIDKIKIHEKRSLHQKSAVIHFFKTNYIENFEQKNFQANRKVEVGKMTAVQKTALL
jgi:hypothetical protein